LKKKRKRKKKNKREGGVVENHGEVGWKKQPTHREEGGTHPCVRVTIHLTVTYSLKIIKV